MRIFNNSGRNMPNSYHALNFLLLKYTTNHVYNHLYFKKLLRKMLVILDMKMMMLDSNKSHRASGKNNISLKFVKFNKCILSPNLTNLFNMGMDQDIFPSYFIAAYVIPIPKTSSPKSLDKFRLIFFLSVFSKLFEKILEKNF